MKTVNRSHFYIYSYAKFGDHCVSYGIVKECSKLYDKIYYLSDSMPTEVFNTNKRLFADIKNVELVEEPYDPKKLEADHCIGNTPYWWAKVCDGWNWGKDGTIPAPWFDESWIFDRQWYMNAAFPFNLKWDNFGFQRNFKKEREVYYDVLGLKDGEEFIFLHEDINRYVPINRDKYITPNLKIIEFSKIHEINILDILYTIEKAKEVHIFNTGLLSFIDLMNIQHINLNYHKYVRPSVLDQPALRLKWNVIENE